MNKDLFRLVLFENGIKKRPAIIAGISRHTAEMKLRKMHCAPNQEIKILKWSKK